MAAKRTVYADVLRIIAILMVITIHVCSSQWNNIQVNSFEWKTFNVFNSFSRSAVPIFVMISGMFLLDPEKDFKIGLFYRKNILHLVTAYIFWSIAYAFFMVYYKNMHWNEETKEWLRRYALDEHYILWYLPMLIGIYILVPVLRTITATNNKKLLEYILIVFFIFGIVIRSMNKLDLNADLMLILNKISLDGFTGYVGYFLLGYYLHKYSMNILWKIVIYELGICSVIITIFGGQYFVVEENRAFNLFFGNHMITTFFEGMAIVVFIKSNKYIEKMNINPLRSKKIITLSSLTFGMYLIHDMVLKLFTKVGFTTLSFNPILSIIILVIAVFIISAVLVYILKKIPLINKYLV